MCDSVQFFVSHLVIRIAETLSFYTLIRNVLYSIDSFIFYFLSPFQFFVLFRFCLTLSSYLYTYINDGGDGGRSVLWPNYGNGTNMKT